jgi:EAL domain-containing protein (putative c-di-GMP-specific phosphodiesterase class I)
VFEWIGANQASFASVGGFAINLSATSLSSPEVMRYLQKVLPDSDFPTDKITFEITETAAIEGYGAAQDFIREIRRYGCKFSLDDFGSGFTSYAHLKNLRTDTLKIDGSFVKDMLTNPGDFAMVKSMNDIGHSLGLRTVAEYVESPLILDALREIGVDYAQGYAIHKPCRLDELMLEQMA